MAEISPYWEILPEGDGARFEELGRRRYFERVVDR